MIKIQRTSLLILVALLATFFSENAAALGAINQSENIFRFQQKLAKNGNAYAQYKLATMYEAGIGVDVDIEQAKQWYQQASTQGVKAAADRVTYLTIKEKGFQKSEHTTWLEGVKSDANKRKVEAMLLLGQLYHNGIGVEKNLDKSQALLTYVNSSGGSNVDAELAAIRDEMNALKVAAEKKRKVTAKQAAVSRTAKTSQKVTQVKATQKKTQNLATKKLSEEKAQAEKRRRYEEVMAQIKLEQQKIDEQQAKVTNGQLVSVDDEF